MNSTTRRTLATLALGAFALGGCELIAEFDRSKIDAGGVDGSFPDAPVADVNQPDSPADTGVDSGDAAADAADGSDTGVDSGDATADASDAADAKTPDASDAAVAALGTAPTSHDYLTLATGTSSADFTFTVTNTGTATSGVPSAALSGADANQFAIATNNCTSALAPLATCTVLVHFSPTATGSMAASLDVSATPGGTASAALTGTGQ